MSCEYEKIRLRNLEDNKRILKELGLLNPFQPLPRVIKKAPKRKRASTPPPQAPAAKKPNTESTDEGEKGSSYEDGGRRRRSARIKGVKVSELTELDDSWREGEADEDEDDATYSRKKVTPNRPNVYGAIPGVDVGTVWLMRSNCSADGIHRPWVAGIHGGADGAYSIALSGGYEDDIDMGDCFTYTGEGGRDLKGTRCNPKNLRTAPQSKDQTLTKGNYALSRSVETGNPVRVIRGYKSHSAFAPEDGYRYDGLYKVEKYWFTTGMSGFGVFKFAFRRLDDQPPPPWTFEGVDPGEISNVRWRPPIQNLGDENNNATKGKTDNQTDDEDAVQKAESKIERKGKSKRSDANKLENSITNNEQSSESHNDVKDTNEAVTMEHDNLERKESSDIKDEVSTKSNQISDIDVKMCDSDDLQSNESVNKSHTKEQNSIIKAEGDHGDASVKTEIESKGDEFRFSQDSGFASQDATVIDEDQNGTQNPPSNAKEDADEKHDENKSELNKDDSTIEDIENELLSPKPVANKRQYKKRTPKATVNSSSNACDTSGGDKMPSSKSSRKSSSSTPKTASATPKMASTTPKTTNTPPKTASTAPKTPSTTPKTHSTTTKGQRSITEMFKNINAEKNTPKGPLTQMSITDMFKPKAK